MLKTATANAKAADSKLVAAEKALSTASSKVIDAAKKEASAKGAVDMAKAKYAAAVKADKIKVRIRETRQRLP